MVTLASRDLAMWGEIVRDEERAGVIPLPAVDTIRLAAGQVPLVVLVAPGLVADATHVIIDVEDMPLPDRLAVQEMLDALGELHDARLVGVFHLGGLDYQFHLHDGRDRELRNLRPKEQAHCWAILRSIAVLCSRYPDMKASRPKKLPGQ
ncbi:MAG: hypothetical protein HY331_06580 [Chloroflexi bacterium]|nr:hypothetical protein [Chloroflexota bacterium]